MRLLDKLKNIAVSKAYKLIQPTDVMRTVKGLTMLGDEIITNSEIEGLKDEVYKIEQMRVWRIMMNTLRADAIERGITKSTNFDDVLTAKSMLVCLDTMESILCLIKNKKV